MASRLLKECKAQTRFPIKVTCVPLSAHIRAWARDGGPPESMMPVWARARLAVALPVFMEQRVDCGWTHLTGRPTGPCSQTNTRFKAVIQWCYLSSQEPPSPPRSAPHGIFSSCFKTYILDSGVWICWSQPILFPRYMAMTAEMS